MVFQDKRSKDIGIKSVLILVLTYNSFFHSPSSLYLSLSLSISLTLSLSLSLSVSLSLLLSLFFSLSLSISFSFFLSPLSASSKYFFCSYYFTDTKFTFFVSGFPTRTKIFAVLFVYFVNVSIKKRGERKRSDTMAFSKTAVLAMFVIYRFILYNFLFELYLYEKTTQNQICFLLHTRLTTFFQVLVVYQTVNRDPEDKQIQYVGSYCCRILFHHYLVCYPLRIDKE